MLSYLRLTPTPIMVKTGTKTPEEADRAKETPAVEVTAIVVTIAETRQSQNMYLKENKKKVRFQKY